jgi:hypothetical protein
MTTELLSNLKSLSAEEVKESVAEYHEAFDNIIVNSILPELKDLILKLNDHKPCKQYQLAIMDLESMIENIASIKTDGPLPRLMEIPLTASEIQEDFVFPEDEIEYAQETTNPEYT